MAWVKSAAHTLTDRKGVTALEYVLIMAAVVPPTIVGFNLLGARVLALLSSVDF